MRQEEHKMVRVAGPVALLLGALLALPIARAAEAPPPMSPAQIALFETPHLASIQNPVRLDYRFRREETGRPTVTDSISLEIRRIGEDGRHDVYPEFLTGERRIAYPPALGFLGNPLLIFAMDRDTRELSAATGGSQHWFRGRFRTALMNSATLQHSQVPVAGLPAPVEATRIEVEPFGNERRAGRFQALRYVFVLSGAVPGGIAEIRSTVPGDTDVPEIVESIVFAGTHAP